MCEYFCIGFIDFMLEGECLLEYTNLLSPTNTKKLKNNIKKFLIEHR